jgi:hypothetical protein
VCLTARPETPYPHAEQKCICRYSFFKMQLLVIMTIYFLRCIYVTYCTFLLLLKLIFRTVVSLIGFCLVKSLFSRHSRTERRSTKLAKSPAGTSKSAVRERGGEGGSGRGRGGGRGREGGGLVGNSHRRRDTVGAPSVALMRVLAGVRGQ